MLLIAYDVIPAITDYGFKIILAGNSDDRKNLLAFVFKIHTTSTVNSP